MNETALKLTLSFDRDLMREALTLAPGKPKPPRQSRRDRVLLWLAMGAVFFVFAQQGWSGNTALVSAVFFTTFGACAMFFVWMLTLRRWRMNLLTILEDADQRNGQTMLEFDKTGMRTTAAFSTTHMHWPVIVSIFPISTGTGIGFQSYTVCIPDRDLPTGVTPEAFRAQLEEWRAAYV